LSRNGSPQRGRKMRKSEILTNPKGKVLKKEAMSEDKKGE
jgi:hypothetical protein